MLVTLVPDPLCRSVSGPHPHGCEPRLELSFRAGAPADIPPFGAAQHLFGRDRWNVRNELAPGTAPFGDRPDHLHVGRVYLEVSWDTDGPGKFAFRNPLGDRGAHPIAGIRQYEGKAHTRRDGAVELRQGDLQL